MDIVLDSNIFRGDILLRSKDFDILIDYLNKTSSALIMPQIIFDEISGLYSRVLKDRIADLSKAANNITLILTEDDTSFNPREIDIEAETEKYKEFIKNKFKISDRHILPYKNDYLPELANRAIARQKPSGDKGQGFRDTLIWLTIRDYTVRCHEKQITLISSNTDDFANQDKIALHESLQKECDKLGIRINYFKTLKDFIENHSIKIDFITYDWLTENLDHFAVTDQVLEDINRRTKSSITSWFQKETGEECTGHYRALGIHPYNDKDLFVYEMVDNKLIVNVTVTAEIEIEFEYYKKERVQHWNYDANEYYHERQPSIAIKYLEVELYVAITVENGEIIDTELSDWDHW